jgi:hypothetical protein
MRESYSSSPETKLKQTREVVSWTCVMNSDDLNWDCPCCYEHVHLPGVQGWRML